MAKAGKKNYEMDMCDGPIMGKILLFALPLMVSSLLQLLFNAADVIVVGRFAGDHALAAVGSNTSLISLCTNFFMGLSVGANVLAARYYAAKMEKDLDETVHTAMLLSIGSGLFLNVLGVIFAPTFLTWMSAPPEVLPLAAQYLRIYFFGMTAMMVYNFGSAILRALGDTRRPLYYLTLAGVINVVLNLIFVIVFKLGVVGVGLATVISQCISGFLVLRCMMQKGQSIALELRRLRLCKDKLIKILRIGVPASVQGLLFSISNVIIQSSINSFGATVVAGSAAAANIEGFVWVSMNAVHQTAISFVSQNYGAGKMERIPKIMLRVLLTVIVVGLVLGNLAFLFGHPLLSLYSSSEMVIQEGQVRLLYICMPYVLCGLMDTMVGGIRGLGYATTPTIVSLLGVCVLRLFWIFTFFRMDRFHTPASLYMTYPVTWSVTFIAHVVCFLVIWKKIKEKIANKF